MRRLETILLIAAALGAPAAARRASVDAFAEPSDIIAAEGAFQHLRSAKGPRTAMRATAQVDAQSYAPLPMRVTDVLKSRAEPFQPPAWQPQRVWMSCDGSYAVSYGAWQKLPVTGWYATVWHRQKGGAYKWVLNLGDALAAALPVPEMIAASVADCPERRPSKAAAAKPDRPAGADHTAGYADDRTLAWSSGGGPAANGFVAQIRQHGAWREVLRVGLAPPAAAAPL